MHFLSLRIVAVGFVSTETHEETFTQLLAPYHDETKDTGAPARVINNVSGLTNGA